MTDFIHRIPPWFWITLVVHFAVLGTVAYLILLERKVASWVQDRLGPNRVGFDFGIIPFLKGKTTPKIDGYLIRVPKGSGTQVALALAPAAPKVSGEPDTRMVQ